MNVTVSFLCDREAFQPGRNFDQSRVHLMRGENRSWVFPCSSTLAFLADKVSQVFQESVPYIIFLALSGIDCAVSGMSFGCGAAVGIFVSYALHLLKGNSESLHNFFSAHLRDAIVAEGACLGVMCISRALSPRCFLSNECAAGGIVSGFISGMYAGDFLGRATS